MIEMMIKKLLPTMTKVNTIEHTDEFKALNAKLDKIEQAALLGAKNVLTLDEVTLMTGLSKGHLYRLTSTQGIPHYKPNGRNLYFKKGEIEEWLLQNRIATIEEINNQATTRIAIGR